MSWVQYVHISLEIWGGVFCAIISIAIFIGRNCLADKYASEMDAAVSLLLFMDACAWFFRGNPTDIGYIMVRFSNFMVFLLTHAVMMLFTSYIVARLGEKVHPMTHTLLWAVYMLSVTGICLVVLNLHFRIIYYFDAQNFYHRSDNYYLVVLSGTVAMVFAAGILIINRKVYGTEMFCSLLSYLLLPVGAVLVQLFHYGISFVNIAIAASMIFIFYSWQISRTKEQMEQKNRLLEQEWQMAEQEKEMDSMQQEMMLSQIQPHFLYNSLTAIAQLCEKDPKQAKKATISFADFLRGNMNALKSREPVPFEQELEHVENYFILEQMRFGEELELVYDIETTKFKVPVLTIQPIVENAVKHGIKRHGTVTLSTRETEEEYEIIIRDDGIGMSSEKKPDDGRSHVGIQNVRYRLRQMCDGTLTYYSKPGEGTTAVICLPKRSQQMQKEEKTDKKIEK